MPRNLGYSKTSNPPFYQCFWRFLQNFTLIYYIQPFWLYKKRSHFCQGIWSPRVWRKGPGGSYQAYAPLKIYQGTGSILEKFFFCLRTRKFFPRISTLATRPWQIFPHVLFKRCRRTQKRENRNAYEFIGRLIVARGDAPLRHQNPGLLPRNLKTQSRTFVLRRRKAEHLHP
jgi:hypothetical protein